MLPCGLHHQRETRPAGIGWDPGAEDGDKETPGPSCSCERAGAPGSRRGCKTARAPAGGAAAAGKTARPGAGLAPPSGTGPWGPGKLQILSYQALSTPEGPAVWGLRLYPKAALLAQGVGGEEGGMGAASPGAWGGRYTMASPVPHPVCCPSPSSLHPE